MNFFGHAVVASWHGPELSVVFGSMLPDLLGMMGQRVPELGESRLKIGVELHYRTDRAFHQGASFVMLERTARRELRERGLEKGARLSIAHVGVELLIDAELAEDVEAHGLYLEALQAGAAGGFDPHLGLDTHIARALAELCRTVHGRTPPGANQDAAALTARLFRALGARPRLCPRPTDRPLIEGWLEETRPRVRAVMPRLAADLRSALELDRR